ncbi:MAG: bifunctional riboflavin kinase/FAD synthetase [Tannerella sp.]|nr:bifunctional riboflavin kinase/FAD synthetase [Tannerella sp.]
MIIINDVKNRVGKEWVATVGFFDGVHLGHRFLINELRHLADEQHLPSAVFTFPVHPRIVLQADYQPKLLNSFEEKMELLETTGVDFCAVLNFTLELANYSASDFISLLADKWRVRTLLIGHDHRFGHNRAEGFDEYVKYGSMHGMQIIQASSYTKDTAIVSSSKIRLLLSQCKVKEAAELLTYPYRLKGHVISGYQVGRKLGFPTANIKVDEPFKVWPGTGVYAVWVYIKGMRYKGMLSVGGRPTFDDENLAVEVHLLHFSEYIYQEQIEVEFIEYLRENKKFDTVEALIAQLMNDKEVVENILSL